MFFVIKSFVAAVILIAVLQIQVGGATLETKAEEFIRSSQATNQLRHVAEGAIKVTSDLWKKTLGWVGAKPADGLSRSKEWNVEFRRKVVKDEESKEE